MAFKLPTMSRETSSTTSTGDMVMAGAQSGYFAFSAGLSNGDTTFLTFKMGSDTEEGLYTYNSGANSFTRTQIYRSTNAGAAINWAAGTKDVICGLVGPSDLDFGGRTNFLTTIGATTRGYLAGLTMSNNAGTPNSKIDVAAGTCRDDTDVATMSLSGTTTLDCGTTGANGLDSGSLAVSTWYHAFIIGKADGTFSTFASTGTNPALPTGYIKKRRIGSFKTDASSHIFAFSQKGDEFLWAAGTAPGFSLGNEFNTAVLGTTATLFTVSVPTAVQVIALLRFYILNASVAAILINSPDETSIAGGSIGFNATAQNPSGGNAFIGTTQTRADTSGRVRVVSSAASTTLNGGAYGWIDTRGRFD